MSTKIDFEIFAEIDLNLTVICLIVYKEQDLARAALKLGVSRLFILEALEELRTHFGYPLFETTEYSIQPTVNGSKVLQFLMPLANVIEPILGP